MRSNLQGFAKLNDELFCIFPQSSDVNVYNIESFAFQRTITVEEIKHPYDIEACENLLYVSECEDKLIHRIQLPGINVSNWTVDGIYLTLSISKNKHVIVASLEPAKIIEYESDGTVVQEIVVDANLAGLQHAIQLERDRFLVCHTVDTHHRVCLIDHTGQVIKYYGGKEGSGLGQLKEPAYLAIYRNGSILVADEMNNRIVQLNSSLEYMNEFRYFIRPRRLCLVEELGKLYVIEINKDQRITLLEM